MLKFSYGWIDKWHNAKLGMQWSPIMGHRFHSLRLREPFSCAFITNSQEWKLYWRIMPLTNLMKVFTFLFACRKLGINLLKGICSWLSRIFALLTHFCPGRFCDRGIIYSTTQVHNEKSLHYWMALP